MRSLLFVALTIGGCSTDPDPGPAYEYAYSYTLDLHRYEPGDRLLPQQPLTLLIDGVPRSHAEYHFASLDEAAAASIDVQLVFATEVITTYKPPLSTTDCRSPGDAVAEAAPPIVVRDNSCVLDQGEIRGMSRSFQSASRGCLGDGFCAPYCLTRSAYPNGCAESERCTSRITHFDPIFSRLRCAPIGPRQLGDACTYTADEAGAYDDCGRDLLCVDGFCRQVCFDDDCVYVSGHSSDLRVRL